MDGPRTGRRHRGRRAVGRDRVRRRTVPPGHRLRACGRTGGAGPGSLRSAARALGPHPGCRADPRAPGHPLRRAHPPRPQAVQHSADDRRSASHRLRHSPGTGHRHRRWSHPHRGAGRFARFHGAGAGAGRAGDRGVRCVLPRLGAGVRGDGQASVRRGGQRGPCADVPDRAGGPGPDRRPGGSGRPRPGLPPQGPGRQADDGRDPGTTGGGRPRRTVAAGRAPRPAGPSRGGVAGLGGPGGAGTACGTG